MANQYQKSGVFQEYDRSQNTFNKSARATTSYFENKFTSGPP